MTDFYYTALGDGRYLPTVRAQGAWRGDEQHMSPVSGLVLHNLMRHEPRDDLQLARVTFEILGVMASDVTSVEVTTIRPGRTITLKQAVATIGERAVVRANAWFLAADDTTSVAGFDARPLPPRLDTEVEVEDLYNKWDGGFIRSLEVLSEPGKQPGRGWSWLRSDTVLVEGEPVDPMVGLLMLADTANGIAPRVPPQQWSFPNTDLSIHLLRRPRGEWLGLDVANNVGPTGLGITSAVLHDDDGPFGYSNQILIVRDNT